MSVSAAKRKPVAVVKSQAVRLFDIATTPGGACSISCGQFFYGKDHTRHCLEYGCLTPHRPKQCVTDEATAKGVTL